MVHWWQMQIQKTKTVHYKSSYPEHLQHVGYIVTADVLKLYMFGLLRSMATDSN